MKPLIGLTPTPEIQVQEHGTFRLHTLNENYSKAVIAAGGIPVMLPSLNTDIEELLNRLDAVIITGGGDVDPTQYGQEKHEKTDGTDVERDAFEQAIIHAAIARDMPLLGICRGIQILNTALGGTLYQDIDDLVTDSQEHRQQSLNIHHQELFQTASLEPGDHPLRNMVGNDTIGINTFHHQCINTLADSLQVMARTNDGVIEAVSKPDMTFGMAVQWHPEMLAERHPEHAAIFTALVSAAADYHVSTSSGKVSELI